MRRAHYQSRNHRPRGRGALGGIMVFVVAMGGAFLIYSAIGWFRNSTADRQGVTTETVSMATVEEDDSPIKTTAHVPFVASGSNVGTLDRAGEATNLQFFALVSLPAIDQSSTSYEVWMVKKGLADVRSVGKLSARADGTWSLQWNMADLAAEALNYTTVVIMLEPNDGNTTPSGNKAAEALIK